MIQFLENFMMKKKKNSIKMMLQKKENQHGKDFEKRFPPSYVYREPLILDYSKALPESLQTLDEKN